MGEPNTHTNPLTGRPKTRYDTRRQASKAARQLGMYDYRCGDPWCGGFHLSSSPKREDEPRKLYIPD